MATQLKTTSENLSKAFERSKDVFGDVTDRAKDLYSDAQRWVPEHRGTVALVSAAAVGFCLIGYSAGRRSQRRSSARRVSGPLREAASAVPGQFGEIDLAPVFKFLKLWMLYRVATRA